MLCCLRHSGQITATTFVPMIDQRLGLAWVFFVSYAAVMDLLFMNLITATIVDTAIGRSQEEEQERREATMTHHRSYFWKWFCLLSHN